MRTSYDSHSSDSSAALAEVREHFRRKQLRRFLLQQAERYARPEAEANALAARGRGGDSEIAHVTPGEIVLHPSKLSPETLAAVVRDLSRHGIGLGRVSVGSPDASINPKTGIAEFRSPGSTAWKADPPQRPDWEVKGNQVPQFRPNPAAYNVAPQRNPMPSSLSRSSGASGYGSGDRGWASSGATGGFPMSGDLNSEGLPTSPGSAFDLDEYRGYYETMSPEELDSAIADLDNYWELIGVGGTATNGAGKLAKRYLPSLVNAVPQVVLRELPVVSGVAGLSAAAAFGLSRIAKGVRAARKRDQGGSANATNEE